METLLSQLTSKGYEVISKETPFYGGSTCYILSKSYGPKRGDCSGGHIAVLPDGTFGYDLFNGGDKYGDHLHSYTPDEIVVDTLPEEDIINFLN